MLAAGIAATPRIATTPATTGHRNLITPFTQWSATLCDSASTLARRRARALPEQIRSPTSPSSAGSRVSAMSTARATVDAATSAIVDSIAIPMTVSAVSAIRTVRPAKKTALPAVPTALPAASCAVSPRSRINRRCRLTTNSA